MRQVASDQYLRKESARAGSTLIPVQYWNCVNLRQTDYMIHDIKTRATEKITISTSGNIKLTASSGLTLSICVRQQPHNHNHKIMKGRNDWEAWYRSISWYHQAVILLVTFRMQVFYLWAAYGCGVTRFSRNDIPCEFNWKPPNSTLI